MGSLETLEFTNAPYKLKMQSANGFVDVDIVQGGRINGWNHSDDNQNYLIKQYINEKCMDMYWRREMWEGSTTYFAQFKNPNSHIDWRKYENPNMQYDSDWNAK